MPQKVTTKTLEYDTDAILDILVDLNTLVVSLDKLGSAFHDMDEETWRKACSDFLRDWRAFHLVANARYVLGSAIEDESELEERYFARVEGMENWSFSQHKPSDEWVERVERRHNRKT